MAVSETDRKTAPTRWGTAAIVAITLLAVVIRVYRLGDWPLADDEIYTKVDGSLAELQQTLTEVRRAAEDAQEQLPVTVLGSLVGSLF